MSPEINDRIKQAIINKEPLSFGKMGNVEFSHLAQFLNGDNVSLVGYTLFVNAGIFTPSYESLLDWCAEYYRAVVNLDYILQWHPDDKHFVENNFPNRRIFNSFQGLEPFVFGKDGWHHSLSDKKVLCVSPFSKTVKMQSEKFSKIWNGASIGHVETVTSPNSEALTGQNPTPWNEKVNHMIEQIKEKDFDFATVGCGGASLLICDFIKNSMGKPCVHLGGGNQILYGIRGRRWDEGFKDKEWYGTEHWVRPSAEEVPQNNHLVEGGCYW